MTATPTVSHQEVLRLLARQDLPGAAAACRALNTEHPDYVPGWITATTIALRLGNPAAALERIEMAASLAGIDPQVLLQKTYCLHALRRYPEALNTAAAARRAATGHPVVLDAVGTYYSFAGEQALALAAYDEAITLAPGEAQFRYNRATVRRFLGDIDGAEADYDYVLARDPGDYEAYKNLADLRSQTAERNHIATLESLLAAGIDDWRGEMQLRHALAKEYEDLGRYERSFAELERGARLRRRHMQYDVGTDVATVDWIIEAFPTAPEPSIRGCESTAPIFIVGLPRSGTTLVERILGSHSAVHSAGELNCFALAIVAAVRSKSSAQPLPRQQLISLSREIDFADLGRDYLKRARPDTIQQAHFTDKMPLNYLYCGLIRRALPNARIVHLTRHPMAACYAIYKTLFKDGYPFSYDLDALASYYFAYRKLMAHWRATMPGSIHELHYERLVADQFVESRRLLEYCGLAWEEACGAFHLSPVASTTASATQVRRPMYNTSIAQWRHYERQLATLRARLIDLGVPGAELDA